ncbi:MAG: hypothetical protein IPK65_05320 [Gammaproteobacteria bacterium]|nr:hypothetical protein [Gammaproteobacteria bacterium]
MKASDIDWAYLRGASRWLLAAALCCAVMVGLSGYYLREQRLEFERLSGERDAVREDYLAAETQGRVTDEYYARYLMLRQSGVVGAERRLDWVEAVRESARHLRLPKLQYQIMPREPFTLASLPAYPGLQVYASRMKLDMELMHEGDLAAVFDRLGRAAPGAMHIDTCVLRRLLDTPDTGAVAPNLVAACELLLFTVQPEAAVSSGEV